MKYTVAAITAVCSIVCLAASDRADAGGRGIRIDAENGAGCMSTYTTDSSNAAALAFTPGGNYASITSCTPIGNTTADLFPDGTLNDSATVNSLFTATGGKMFQYFTGAVGAGVVPDAQVSLWSLATGPFGSSETEVELNGWCPPGSSSASFKMDGVTFTGGCGSSPDDLLLNSTGGIVGYVSIATDGTATIFSGKSVPGWTVGGGTVSAPEIDPSHVVGGLTLLLGGLAVLRGGRRMQIHIR